jgi:hypothetical protein
MKKLPKYVHGYTDRLGNARFYYKRTGCKATGRRGPSAITYKSLFDAR